MSTGTPDFYCDRCGKCCAGLGSTIVIAGNPAPGVCIFRDRVSGESRTVRAGGTVNNGPGVCPFFRRDPAGGSGSCAIYDDRPTLCRKFRCYDLAVIGPDGRITARIKGTGLATKDPAIRVLFESVALPADAAAGAGWLATLRCLLSKNGYTVVG